MQMSSTAGGMDNMDNTDNMDSKDNMDNKDNIDKETAGCEQASVSRSPDGEIVGEVQQNGKSHLSQPTALPTSAYSAPATATTWSSPAASGGERMGEGVCTHILSKPISQFQGERMKGPSKPKAPSLATLNSYAKVPCFDAHAFDPTEVAATQRCQQSTRSTQSTQSTRSTRSTWRTRSTWSTWSTRSTRSKRSTRSSLRPQDPARLMETVLPVLSAVPPGFGPSLQKPKHPNLAASQIDPGVVAERPGMLRYLLEQCS